MDIKDLPPDLAIQIGDELITPEEYQARMKNEVDTLHRAFSKMRDDWVQYRALEDGAHFVTPSMVGVNGNTVATFYEGTVKTVSSLPSVIMRRDGSASTDFVLYLTIRNSVPTDYRAVTVTARRFAVRGRDR